MEKSSELIDFEEWELIPSSNHRSFIEFDLLSDANYFAEDNKNPCKDIMIVPAQPSPLLVPIVSFKKLNDDELCIDKEVEPTEIEKEEKPVFKWRVLGGRAGSWCSVGFAALTLCVFILGDRQLNDNSWKTIQFQVYENKKKIKGVPEANRMNRAFSGGRRGRTTATRARVFLGGYYNGFL